VIVADPNGHPRHRIPLVARPGSAPASTAEGSPAGTTAGRVVNRDGGAPGRHDPAGRLTSLILPAGYDSARQRLGVMPEHGHPRGVSRGNRTLKVRPRHESWRAGTAAAAAVRLGVLPVTPGAFAQLGDRCSREPASLLSTRRDKRNIGTWCNGSTLALGACGGGSTPPVPTRNRQGGRRGFEPLPTREIAHETPQRPNTCTCARARTGVAQLARAPPSPQQDEPRARRRKREVGSSPTPQRKPWVRPGDVQARIGPTET
jgi:hypothetical protein